MRFPGRKFEIVSHDAQRERFTVRVWSDVYPPEHYLYVAQNRAFHLLGQEYEGLSPRAMAPMERVTYTARDGLEALESLQRMNELPEVILLDIEMPRMDGYEFATHVRNDARFSDLPIIMITSRVGDKHRARAIEIGVNDYLGKPYQDDQLLDSIKRLLAEQGVEMA